MSRYTTNGKRLSSMTHARKGHSCDFCDRTAYGNGGRVAHGRAHVRRGEAVELFKDWGTWPLMTDRAFFAPGDPHIAEFLARGYELVKP